jgi:hypothetical protein
LPSGVVAVILMVLLGPILVGLRSFSPSKNRRQEAGSSFTTDNYTGEAFG